MPTHETVLNKPLSGAEVRKIILAKLDTALSGDTRLADYVSIPSFRFRLDLALILNHAVEGNITVTKEDGIGTVDEATAMALTRHLEQTEMPPNVARVDAGLGVPVLTADEKGRPIEKEVVYGKEKLARYNQSQADAEADTGADRGDPHPRTVTIPTVKIPGIG